MKRKVNTQGRSEALKAKLSPLASREAMLAAIRPWLAAEKQQLRQAFLSTNDALTLVAGQAALVDMLIEALYDKLSSGQALPVAVVAVGGYGRSEVFPYSDIDLLFLHDTQDTLESERVLEQLLYLLWDSELTVGQSHMRVDEALALARQDITVRTNFLDARFLAGDRLLFDHFNTRFEKEIVVGSAPEFIDRKLAERDVRHKRFGDSRYVLEPNIKEGKGGLRDLQTLWWLARYAYPIADLKKLVKMGLLTHAEYRSFARTREFLYRVRIHLHYLADRAEERLTFDRQHALAVAMGFSHAEPHRAVLRFMRRYFAAVRMVGLTTRIFCALLEEEKKRAPRRRLGWQIAPWKLGGFVLDGERLNVRQPRLFERRPAMMLEFFRVVQLHDLKTHPRALQLVARNLQRIGHKVQNDKRAGATFLDILMSEKNAEATLRQMSDAGVLGRFIPEFGRVTGQTQFNMYHVYTVDEHTLVAVGILHAIENGLLREELPLASNVIKRIGDRRALYLAMFCHDIAKGRPGEHSQLGVASTRKLALRFGLTAAAADTTAWLVEHHLLFSATALKRDLSDPKTIEDFVAVVQSPERLKLLFLITVADIRAVSASVWNPWKASLLRELYNRADALMTTGSLPAAPGTDMLADALARSLPGWSEDEIAAYLARCTPAYLSSLNVARHAVVARMLKQAALTPQPLLIDTHHEYERSHTEIIVATPDRPGLFSMLAGAMALAGANIIGAKIFTLSGDMAIDIFQVQDAAGDVFDRPDRLAKLSVYIEQILSGELDLRAAFADMPKPHGKASRVLRPVEGQVFIENDASNIHTLIEVSGPDRSGLLYQITDVLAELGISIVTAHITTYGAQISDVFYVKDAFGMKIRHAEKMDEVRERLLAVINIPASA